MLLLSAFLYQGLRCKLTLIGARAFGDCGAFAMLSRLMPAMPPEDGVRVCSSAGGSAVCLKSAGRHIISYATLSSKSGGKEVPWNSSCIII